MRDRDTRRSFVGATAVCIGALALRVPSAFRLPQFYAEEGRYFFADAYNDGWRSILETTNGYFHLLPRLLANLTLSLGIPYAWIPAIFVYGCLPFYVLLWARIHTRLELPMPARFALCLATVLVPVGSEVFMNQTNIQWLLAPVPVVLYLGRPASDRSQRWIDAAFLTLSLFTGPYALFVVPLIAIHARLTGSLRPHRGLLALGAVAVALSVGSLWQFGTLNRIGGPAQATPFGFAQLATRTFYSPWLMLGVLSIPRAAVLVLALALPGVFVVLVRALLRSRNHAALLMLGCSLAAFGTTVVSYGRDPMFPSPFGNAMRTFYLPAVFLLWALIIASPWDRRAMAWWAAVAVWYSVQIPSFNSLSYWATAPPDRDWHRFAARLEAGEALIVPITPPGWAMTLEAKPVRAPDGG